MPTYSYRCAVCGPFDLLRPMTAAAADTRCPDCGRTGLRVYGAPALRGMAAGLRSALDAQGRSADSPEVVRSVSPAGRRPTPIRTDPRHARLPRP